MKLHVASLLCSNAWSCQSGGRGALYWEFVDTYILPTLHSPYSTFSLLYILPTLSGRLFLVVYKVYILSLSLSSQHHRGMSSSSISECLQQLSDCLGSTPYSIPVIHFWLCWTQCVLHLLKLILISWWTWTLYFKSACEGARASKFDCKASNQFVAVTCATKWSVQSLRMD